MNEKLDKIVTTVLEANKAINISDMDVRELTDITDYMIICTATSTRHAKSLADKVLEASRNHGLKAFGVEGDLAGEWVLIDLCDVIVHIMVAEVRNFYNLEKLWAITEPKLKREAL